MLTRTLQYAGARVEPFVPHRMRDGYDFRDAGLRKAREIDAGLILTCDCGITAVETVRQAEAAGFRVVVTDHHLPGAELPPATAIVDPQQPGMAAAPKRFAAPAAFKLVQALFRADLPANPRSTSSITSHWLPWRTSLTGENAFCPSRPETAGQPVAGRALASVAGLTRRRSAGYRGFARARLNAAGRVGDAGDAPLLTGCGMPRRNNWPKS
jgi:single-stranded-DNA-specific exonuclease